MSKLTIEDLAIDHDYYCSESNFYSNDASLSYETFKEFLDEFEDADVDMNLVFRWDLKKYDDSDISKGYYMEIYQMKQRKGIFTPIEIVKFEEDDIEGFVKYIKPHIDKLKNIWKPFDF